MVEAPAIAEKPQKKRLAVFLDGTWNAVGDNTNVWRLKSLCAPKASDGVSQLVYYDIGVNGFIGGAFGKGLNDNVTEAYEWLIDVYSPGDDIFIFGFSRGAYTARSLAGLIAKHGLLKAGAPLGVKQLYERYRRKDDRTVWQLHRASALGQLTDATVEEQWLLKYSQPINIKVVAVWDTVGALGIPFFSIQGISRRTFGFLHTGLRTMIENGYHALAIDEHRKDFAPTLWTVHKPKDPTAFTAPPRSLSSVEQRWFVGAHANVGGGCESDLLAQIPLRWIMKKASLHGLAFKNDVDLDGNVLKAPISDSFKEFMKGAYSMLASRFYRTIGAEPEQAEDGTHTTVNETIDASVFERWQKDQTYRPPSLVEWGKRKKVDISALRQPVRADSPSVAAPG
jgi:uncharacterized protein (DUF2235 family)